MPSRCARRAAHSRAGIAKFERTLGERPEERRLSLRIRFATLGSVAEVLGGEAPFLIGVRLPEFRLIAEVVAQRQRGSTDCAGRLAQVHVADVWPNGRLVEERVFAVVG